MENTKVCCSCKEEKILSEFYPRRERGLNEYRSKCKKCCSEYGKKNKDKMNYYCRKSYQKHIESNREKATLYRKNNPEKVKEIERKSRIKYKEKRSAYSVNYTRNKRKTDELFYLRYSISNNIRESFKKKSIKKQTNTEEILGCSIDFFRTYIKNQFSKGMNFNNHGEWHLDHIIPISTAKNKEDILRLCHYTNYQPLWAKDNLSKNNRIVSKQLILF
jgi:hypothetical protein